MSSPPFNWLLKYSTYLHRPWNISEVNLSSTYYSLLSGVDNDRLEFLPDCEHSETTSSFLKRASDIYMYFLSSLSPCADCCCSSARGFIIYFYLNCSFVTLLYKNRTNYPLLSKSEVMDYYYVFLPSNLSLVSFKESLTLLKASILLLIYGSLRPVLLSCSARPAMDD